MFFLFFYDIVKLNCELRHKLFTNLPLRQISNFRPSALCYKNLRSTTGKLIHSALCGSNYAPPPCLGYWLYKTYKELFL